ncbi:MAG: hypothetical protein AABW71_03120 [Nanoarchaeota archaeon]
MTIGSFIGRHKGKLLGLALAAGAFTWAYTRPNRGEILIVDDILYSVGIEQETIYNGKLGSWNVFYEERKDGNHMSAKKGSVRVQYTDDDDFKPLNWDANAGWDDEKKRPKPLNGKLEHVVFTDKKGTLEFSRADIDESTYSSRNKNEVFTNANAHYEAFLNAIILAKRGESDEELSRYLEAVKGN